MQPDFLAQQNANKWLDASTSQMTEELIELCNLNSGSYHLAGLQRVAKRIAEWADLAPAVFQQVNLPSHASIETGPLLRWDFQPRAARRVLLMIHYDTVFSPEHDFQRCELLSPKLLRGPGVADAKGGIVVLRYALQAIIKFGLASELGWTVLLNPDEEVGSHSSAPVMRNIATQFDFGLLFEPALPDGALISQRKGSGNFTISVRGQAAHAGRYFDRGRNAIAELSRIVAALDALNGKRPDTTINVGLIEGGGPVNVVPDMAIAKLNVRAPDAPSAEWFESQCKQIVAQTSQRDGFTAELQGSFTSPPKTINAAQQAMMDAIEQCSMNLQLPPVQWRSTGGVCDGNKLAAAGLPNIDTLGPRGDGLHSNQECVQLDSLPEKAKLVVEILCQFAAGNFDNLIREKAPNETR